MTGKFDGKEKNKLYEDPTIKKKNKMLRLLPIYFISSSYYSQYSVFKQ